MNEIIISCPPTGNTLTASGDCNSAKTYCWTTNQIGEINYYTPRINNVLVSFNFTKQTNNGSTIVVELIYYTDGVKSIKETWNLGTLSTAIKKYHKFDFGKTSVNNSFELKVTTTGGTSGCFDVYFDCSVNVASSLFCSGTTHYSSGICACGSNDFLLYAEILDSWQFIFPLGLANVIWYLDPELQIKELPQERSFVDYLPLNNGYNRYLFKNSLESIKE
jgi:hypothetical protein